MRFIPHTIISVILGCLMSCSEPPSTTSHSYKEAKFIKKPTTIRAILNLKDSVFSSSMDAYVEATILNYSSTDFSSSQEELSQAILAVEVFNEKGERMPTIPPSTPPNDTDKQFITIKPSEAFLITYDLHIFNPILPKGSYTIKMKNMPSNTLSFSIE